MKTDKKIFRNWSTCEDKASQVGMICGMPACIDLETKTEGKRIINKENCKFSETISLKPCETDIAKTDLEERGSKVEVIKAKQSRNSREIY